MKSLTKRRVGLYGLLTVLAAVIAAMAVLFAMPKARADEDENIGKTYYYSELARSAIAQNFYKLIDKLATDGSLASGIDEYDLVSNGVLTEDDVVRLVDYEAATVPVALGAARDAYYMDHPELFYIDVYKLFLSAGMQSGKYVAYLGTGNAENYFVDYTVTKGSEVAGVVSKYNAALDAAVAEVKKAGTDVVKLVTAANKYVVDNVDYDYGAYKDAASGNIIYDGYVNTSYGALVNKNALCGGYARAFKAILDKLDIPCVLIRGNAVSGADVVANTGETLTAGLTDHMWTAVQIDGLWYGVDPTWNDGEGISPNKYLLVGDDFLSDTHTPDPVISSSGFELKYPALRALNYGVNEDSSGFTFKDSGTLGGKEMGYCTHIGDSNEEIKFLRLGVSYEGKDAEQLAEEGKYLAYSNDGATWYNFAALIKIMSLQIEMGGVYIDGYSVFDEMGWKEIRYAIFDCEPDTDSMGVGINIGYSAGLATAKHIVAVSATYINDAYGTYIPAPYVKKMTPDNKGGIKNFDPLKITLEFSEKMVKVKESDPIGVRVYGKHTDIDKYIKVEDVKWDEASNTLSFIFTPSLSYAHNSEMYNFVPTNLVSEKSGKEPAPGQLSFKRKTVVCPKVFNDGRLYMQVFGQPAFVGAEDMSLTDFKDKNGKPVVGNLLSQLMLVVEEPSDAENKKMEDALLADSDIGIEKSDIKASSTYQINLQMCGCVQKVPTGSYMQVGFGFPEGYGPEDAGVTFTVYHYTRNADGTIASVEKIPCVVSEYGIIATVKSFSPFMICAVDSSKAGKDKNVYASVEGKGGSINETVVKSVEEGGEIEYTLTPDDGYALLSVMLNGADITDKVVGNKLALGYADLDKNNTITVYFVSERVQKYREDNKLEIVQPQIVVKESDMIQAVGVGEDITTVPGKSNNTAIIVTVVVSVVVVLAGVGVALFFILKKKKDDGDDGKGGSPVKASASNNASKSSRSSEKPASAENKKTDAAKSTAAAARPANDPTRPTNASARPAVPARPAGGTAQNRPTPNASRPNTEPAARPASTGTARPTTANARPATPARPASGTAQNRPTPNASRPNTANAARPASTGTARPTNRDNVKK